MTIMIRRMVVASPFALLFVASMAAAQAPNTVSVRGTIASVDDRILDVKTRGGVDVKVKLADDARILASDRKSLADLKQGAFVGITAMPQPDGTRKAVEIHIFPEALRGTGEGQRPSDLIPNSTMTNASVESSVASVDGEVLVLKYKDGEQKFIVPSNVEVSAFTPATLADLKPGEKVFVVAAKRLRDGTLEAPNIVVGRSGVNPLVDVGPIHIDIGKSIEKGAQDIGELIEKGVQDTANTVAKSTRDGRPINSQPDIANLHSRERKKPAMGFTRMQC